MTLQLNEIDWECFEQEARSWTNAELSNWIGQLENDLKFWQAPDGLEETTAFYARVVEYEAQRYST